MGKKGAAPGPEKALALDPREGDQISFEFDVNLAQAVLKGNANHVEAMQVLGHALTKLARHLEALSVDRRITLLRPDDEIAFYNLACSHSNVGNIDEALSALERAIALGYVDAEFIQKDTDLENLRKDPRFLQLLHELHRRRKLGTAH